MLPFTVLALTLGMAAGRARGGRLDALLALRVRWPWLVAIAWSLQLIAFTTPAGSLPQAGLATMHLVSLLLLGILVFANRRLPGVALVGLGLILNAAVVLANGGFMPLAPAAAITAGTPGVVNELHASGRFRKNILMHLDTPLWPLGDILPAPVVGSVYSVGDIVIVTGAFVLVYGGMGRHRRRGVGLANADA